MKGAAIQRGWNTTWLTGHVEDGKKEMEKQLRKEDAIIVRKLYL